MTATIKDSGDSGYFDEELMPCRWESGRWVGSLAKKLGLAGCCRRHDFHALARGIHPRSRASLRPRSSGVSWYGLAISVPVSVSVLAQGDPRVFAWLRESVAAAVPLLESFARVRDQRKGQVQFRTLRGPGLAIAQFQHVASRAREPELHHHLVIFNLACDGDTWRALDARELYRCQALINCAVLGDLAMRLVAGGYEVYPRNDGYEFEVTGVPTDALREHFGSRRQTILEGLANSPDPGIDRRRRRRLTDRIAILTRADKTSDAECNALHDSWSRLPPTLRSKVESCVELAGRRADRQTSKQATSTVDFGNECRRHFGQQWVGDDVSVISFVCQENWGERFGILEWLAGLRSGAYGLASVGANLYAMPEQVTALAEFATMGLRSVSEGPGNLMSTKISRRETLVVSANAGSTLADDLGVEDIGISALQTLGPRIRRRTVVIDVSRAASSSPTWCTNCAALILRNGGTPLLYSSTPSSEPLDSRAQNLLLDATVRLSGRQSLDDGADCPEFEVVGSNKAVTSILEVPESRWFDLMVERVAHSFSRRERRCAYIGDPGVAAELGKQVRSHPALSAVIRGPGQLVWTLVRTERRQGLDTDTGDEVIEFTQNHPAHPRGSRVKVLGREREILFVEDHQGYTDQFSVDNFVAYETYRRAMIPLAPGDCIRITQPRRIGTSARLAINRIYVVAELLPDGGIVLTNGARLAPDFGHIEYAYACADPGRIGCRGAVICLNDHRANSVLAELLKARRPLTLVTSDARGAAADLGFEISRKESVDEFLRRAKWAPPEKKDIAHAPVASGHIASPLSAPPSLPPHDESGPTHL